MGKKEKQLAEEDEYTEEEEVEKAEELEEKPEQDPQEDVSQIKKKPKKSFFRRTKEKLYAKKGGEEEQEEEAEKAEEREDEPEKEPEEHATVQDSQNEVCENVESESQALTFSANALSSSLIVSATPVHSVDRDTSNEESIVSIDRGMPADDIPKPLPDDKKHDREEDATVCESVESGPEPVVLSTNTSASPSISLTPAYSEDIDIPANESIMSPDIPEQDISSIPLPDEKKDVEEKFLEKVTPALPELENETLAMYKSLKSYFKNVTFSEGTVNS